MQKNNSAIRVALITGWASSGLIVGCVSVPNTPLPTTAIPDDWHNQPQAQTHKALPSDIHPCFAEQATPCANRWWTVLQDDNLNAFVDSVMAHNRERKIAALTVQKTQLTLDKDRQARGWVLSNTASLNRSGTHDLAEHTTQHSHNNSLGTTASWELDLWGKLADQQAISQWEQHASIADQQALYLSLSANAVRSYFNLINLNQRIDLAKATLAHDQTLQKMLDIQLKAGKIAPIDKVTLAQSINQHQQNYQNLLNQKNELLATMALAMGDNLGALSAKFPALANVRPSNRPLPAMPIGLPAQVLANRPDIQTAVWRLKQAFAQADIAQKNLYPNIVLTAGASTASPQLQQLLKLPVLSWGLAVNLPPLNPKEAQRTLQTSDIATQQAVLIYQDTLYKALADIEAKLSQYQYQNSQRQLIEQNYQQSQQLLKANQLRYRAGSISLKQLLDAQEDSRQSLLSLADAHYQQKLAWINLNQALGGITLMYAEKNGEKTFGRLVP